MAASGTDKAYHYSATPGRRLWVAWPDRYSEMAMARATRNMLIPEYRSEHATHETRDHLNRQAAFAMLLTSPELGEAAE